MTSLLQLGTVIMLISRLVSPVALSPNGKQVVTPKIAMDTSKNRSERVCAALDYVLSHCRKEIGNTRFFLVKVDADPSAARPVAAYLASRYPNLSISSVRNKQSPSKQVEIAVNSQRVSKPNESVMDVTVIWTRKHGFSMSLLLVRHHRKWQVTKTFGWDQM